MLKKLNLPKKFIAIIANGEFPKDNEILNYLRLAQYTIACDGAYQALHQTDIIPSTVIGDFDSNQITIPNSIEQIIIHDQNSNDLSKALTYTLNKYGQNVNIVIFAANGKREDHAFANIAILNQWIDKFTSLSMISDYGIFDGFSQQTSLTTIIGQQISFFILEQQHQITCHELKWPLIDFTFTSLYHGSLNQATKSLLHIDCNTKFIVYRAFEIKN